FGLGQSASAAIVLQTGGQSIQQTAQAPCIITGQNCPTQPAGFAVTEYNNTGNLSDFDLTSRVYTVDQIRSIVGNLFYVGLDVNQSNAAQTLDLFSINIGGVLTTYTGPTSVPVIAHGSGWADY